MAVAVATAPWSGHPWSSGASATGLIGGGAATPVLAGAGFNWGSIVGSKVGGRVSSSYPVMRGNPVNATFVRGYPTHGNLAGLGQDTTGTTADVFPGETDVSSVGTTWGATSGGTYPLDSTSITTNTSSPSILQSILNAVVPSATKIGSQALAQASPVTSAQAALMQAQAYKTAAGAQTQVSLTAMLPMILIIGGVFVMIMVMKK